MAKLRALATTLFFVTLSLRLPATPLFQSVTSLPSFDVASVKLNPNPPNLGARVMSLRLSLKNGTLTFEAYSLKNLIFQAYDINAAQLVGCSGWCESDMFDVIAKAEDPNTPPEQIRLMLQRLLMERFNLKVHRETREVPGYVLRVSKSGSKLKAAKPESTIGAGLSGYVRIFQKLPISALVNFLAGQARQPVIDNTGLQGLFDFTIDLTPRENDVSQVSPNGRPAIAADPTNGWSRLSAAVEDQLGLKLEPTKVPTENVVVDKVDRLLPN
jgi:uncharacterized protein (TIGR03435 family)